MAQLALPQATIEYQEFGPQDSPHAPALFVHGILVDGRLWRGVAEGLVRRGFRCIVPTLPLGSHTIPVGDPAALNLPGVAEMINDMIVALDLSDVTLVGSDTGGGLCQLVIDAHPKRIGRLLLTNCDAFDKCPPVPVRPCVPAASRARQHQGAVSTTAVADAASFTAGLRPAHRPTRCGPHRRLAAAVPRGFPHLPRSRGVATDGGHVRSHRRGHPPAPIHQAGHSGVGPTGPLLHPRVGAAPGRAVQQRDADRGARRENLCLP